MTNRQIKVLRTWLEQLSSQDLSTENKAERIAIAFGFLLSGGLDNV